METEARNSYTLTVRATPEEYERIWKLAGQYNASMNRYLLDAALNARLQAPPVMAVVGDVNTPDAYLDSLGKIQGELKRIGEHLFELQMSFGEARKKGEIEEKYAFECVLFLQNIDFLTGNIEEYAAGEAHALAGREAWA
jgi:hypothetical protein